MSQNLNYKLDEGRPLTINEKFVHANLQKGMHTQNADMVLYRGAHQNFLEGLGVKNYHTMTEAQLQKALVGLQYQSKSYTSSSYDKSKNPFLSGAQAGGREIEMTIKQGGKTLVMLGARKQAEVITNIGTNYKITGVKFTGRTASPRGSSSSFPVLHLDIETI